MTGDALKRAAEARGAACRAAADRPQKRRAGEATGSPAIAVTRARPTLRVKSSGDGPDTIEFAGYASVTESAYDMWDMFGPYTEVVSRGAFGASLARADLDVPLVIGHNDNQRLARTTIPEGPGSLQLSEDDTGLLSRALLDPNDPDVARIVPKIRSGLVDEMSFKFRIDRGQWSADWTEFHIEAADIHRGDVAICGYGANPATSATVRSANLADLLEQIDDNEARIHLEVLQARFAPKTPPGPSRLAAALERQYRSAL